MKTKPQIKTKHNGVYRARNKIDRRVYIGSSSSKKGAAKRIDSHINSLRKGRHCNRFLQRAWDKYGEDAFTWKVIEWCKPEDCLRRENHWLKHYQAANPRYGYNLCPVAGNCLGVKHTAETRAKVSAAGKGRKQTPEWIEKRAAKRRGMKRSAESNKKQSESMKKLWEKKDRAAWSKKMRKRKLTPEVRAILSANGKASGSRPKSQATKDKLSKAKTGMKMAKKHRLANSKRTKARWADPVKRARMVAARRKWVRDSLSARFWKKVNKHGPTYSNLGKCWEWTGKINHQGYGVLNAGRASRVSWQLNVGEIPKGLCVLHKCYTRACVRPTHLHLGTRSDKIGHMKKAGRLRSPGPTVPRKGELHSQARLTEKNVIEIRKKYSPGAVGKALAKKFKITYGYVRSIVSRCVWKHI